MNKIITLTFKAIIFSFILIGLLLGGLYLTFSPKLSGELVHTHASYGNISIRRDDNGIPHIKAQNLDSACYGQGFATAQDRLFNMYVKRALIQGKLSELDTAGVNSDTFFRTIGVNRIAEKTMKSLSQDSLNCLQAYADGINDYYHSLAIKPLEFLIISAEWKDWTPYDSICFIKFMYFLLSMDYMFEPMRTQLAEQFGADDALFMTGIHSEKQMYPVTVLNDEELQQSGIYQLYQKNQTSECTNNNSKFSEETKRKLMNTTLSNLLYDLYSTSYGSNSWVIHGNYTESGKPILSNDPHLSNSIPCVWYQIELLMEDTKKTVHGASMPGIPLVMIGRTDFASWGITVLYADNTDLYVEKVEGDKYLLDDEWKDLRIVKEVINVKGEDSFEIDVKYTHRGPLIDYTTDFHFKNPFQKHGLTTSLAFTASFEIDNTIDNFKTIINAKSTLEIRDSFARLVGPALSLLYSTSTGDIGYFGISRIPYTNHPEMGPFLKDGTTSKYDWVNITNGNENPQIINPKKGYIVAANNKFATNNIKHHYSISISTTPRASRIDELIQEQIKSGRKFNTEDMKRIMFDTVDIFARDALPNVIKLFEKFGDKVLNNDQKLIQQAKHTLKQLEGWDFRFDANCKQAPYFAAWEYLYSDKSMHSFKTTPQNRAILTKGRLFWNFQFLKIQDWSNGSNTNFNELWCHTEENSKTGHACLYNIFMALVEAQKLLDQKYIQSGNPVRNWGNLHVNNFPHFPFNKTILKKIFNRSFPGFGNARTVAVAIPNYLYDSFHANQGANFRIIFDMNEPYEKNYYLVDTGSSENIFSPHYDDQLKMHDKFIFIEMKSGFKNFMQNSKYVYELIYKNNTKQESKKNEF